MQHRGKRKDRNKGKASAQKQGEGGGTLRDLRGVKRRNRNENVFARPNRLRESAETAISCRRPGPTRKMKGVPGIPVVEGRRKKLHRCALIAKQ